MTVYEQASELSDVGAGIVVPPNMVRPLRRVGLAERLPDFAVRLEAAWEFRRWQDGRVLFVQPMGEECERLYGGHCYVAHRADLRAMFRQALPDQALRLDERCVGVNQVEDEVELLFVNRSGKQTRVMADVVIGADGIHSTIRGAVIAPAEPRSPAFARFDAWSQRTTPQRWPFDLCIPCGLAPVATLCTTRSAADAWSMSSPSLQRVIGAPNHGRRKVRSQT